jgi:hypothetical protein
MILSFTQWIQATDFFTYLRGSGYVYPVVLSLHMVALGLFGGLILITDLRLLGIAMARRPVSDVIDQLRMTKRWGLVIMVTLGLLLAGCKAEEYYFNIFFRFKLMMLTLIAIHAATFRRSVYAKAAEMDRAGVIPGNAKVAAALSLLLWVATACMGRGIGYIDPPFGIHAQLMPMKTSEPLGLVVQDAARRF